jgi:hypothetical protein
MNRWEGTVLYSRSQSSASEAGCYKMPGSDGREHKYMYGMPAPFDLEDGAELHVTIEVVKPGRFKLNPWRVKDCEVPNVELWHRKIINLKEERYHGIVDGRCSYCGMSEKLVRQREGYKRLVGEPPPFVNYDPYDGHEETAQ